MALITCSECGTQVSDKAPACPKCGCPTSTSEVASLSIKSTNDVMGETELRPAKSRRTPVIGGVAAAAILIALAVGGYFYFAAKQEEQRQHEVAARVEAERQHEAARVEAEKKAAQEAEARRLEIEAAAKRQAEELRAREEETRQRAELAARQSITSNPGTVLEASEFKFFDKGFLNSYRQLIGVSILNKSKYALHGISGQVEWLTDSGTFVGASPFTLNGSIPGGDTKAFSSQDGTLQSGTIQGTANRVRLRFSPAEIVE